MTEPLVAASYCHCKRCQRRTGAAASPNAHPASDAFRIVAGEDNLRMWKPQDGSDERFNIMSFRVAVSLDGTSWDKEAK